MPERMKTFLTPGRLQAAQKLQIVPGDRPSGWGVWPGEQALTILQTPVNQLFFAGGRLEIGGGAAHIVDISLKVPYPW